MKNKRLGWIGTGVMGASMAENLLNAGFDKMTVYNRTKSKAKKLLEKGAFGAENVAELGRNSDIVFLMVGFPKDVRETVLGENPDLKDGLCDTMAPGGIIVDMSTSRPDLAVELSEILAKKGITFLDAPVSGGDVGAKNGTLSIMIGGDETVSKSLDEFWRAMGKTVVYHGPSGSGQHAKMVNQILVAANMSGLSEALLYAIRSGLDLEKVFSSVSEGAGGSWALSNMGPRMLKGDFAPGFYVEHLIKDVEIALDEANRMGMALPGLSIYHQLYKLCAAQGHARDGTQALILALAEINRIEL